MIKRLTGLPGDLIVAKGEEKIIYVPNGYCWIEGDNARRSMDSNTFGVVREASPLLFDHG